MRKEELRLSQRDRDRMVVLAGIERGHWSQREGAGQLGLSTRWVRKLLRRRREEGDGGIVHRLRGRVSNRRIGSEVREQVMRAVRQRYGDFGPTLASERLAAEGMRVSRETLRKWMAEEGLWEVKKKRLRQVHVWRERRGALGELVMMDSSRFRWLEERGPELSLIAMMDDATSRLWGRFVEHDTTEENLRTLGGWLERHGRPLSLYTDRNSLFVTTRPVQQAEQLQGQVTTRTQFGRALYELGIGWIPAHSPQAKGRIERLFGTLQDRLVKQMRLAGITTVEEANRYWEEVFLPFWEQRFTVEPRRKEDAHRELGPEQRLEEILSVRVGRQVSNDYTVSWRAQTWAIAREQARPGMRGARVEVEQRLDGSMWLRFRGSYLKLTPCPAPRPASPSGLRPPGLAATKAHTPAPNHPWNRKFLSG
jgi:DNA-binding Lrp family transcriptional regulator